MKFTNSLNCRKMTHPGKKLIEEIRNRNWTQKQFAVFVGKKNSEVNELIKGKRNITIQWDLILSEVFGTPEKYWINMQTDYDYEIAKKERERQKMEQKQEFEIVSDIEKDKAKEIESSQIEAGPVEKDSESSASQDTIVQSLEDKKGKDSVVSHIVEDEIQQKQGVEKEQNQQIFDELQPEQVILEESEERQKKRDAQKIFVNF